jgi:ankyrin repeat protein
MLAEHSSEEKGHALHAAVEPGHAEMVEWLLANGADPNVRDWRGKTPLDTALANGHASIAEVLRAHGGIEAPEQEQKGA